MRLLHVSRQKRQSKRPRLCARQQNQPARQLPHPLPFHGGLRLGADGLPAPRQQLAQMQIALMTLHQQDHARQRTILGGWHQSLDHHLGAQNRLHPFLLRGLVELECSEHVVEIGQRQGRLTIPRGCSNSLVDTHGAIDHGKLGMKTEVHKHAGHCRWPGAPLPPSQTGNRPQVSFCRWSDPRLYREPRHINDTDVETVTVSSKPTTRKRNFPFIIAPTKTVARCPKN